MVVIRLQDIEMTHWVIYFSPKDYPGRWVMRCHHIVRGYRHPLAEKSCRVADSLEEARSFVPLGLSRLERDPNDVASLVEVWI